MRANLHQSNPTITTVIRPNITPSPDRRGDSVSVTSGVPVASGEVRVGLGEGVVVGGPSVAVAVAGGVTRRINFCSGRMTEALFSPFQAIRSASGTS